MATSAPGHFLVVFSLDVESLCLLTPLCFSVKITVEHYTWAARIVVSHPTYLVVQQAPFVHLCQEVLEVLQGLEAPVVQEGQGAQPRLQVL